MIANTINDAKTIAGGGTGATLNVTVPSGAAFYRCVMTDSAGRVAVTDEAKVST